METKILKYDDAIKWHLKEIQKCIKNFEDSAYTASEAGEIITDLLENIETIKKNNWEWVAIMECPMVDTTTGIIVKKVKIGE